MEKIRNFLEQDEAEKQKLREERETRGRRGSGALLAALLASSHIQGVASCDRSLYVTSTNTICEEARCTETNTFLLNIENNMKICFNGLGTNSFALKLTKYESVATYDYIYKTSSYRIATKAHSVCKGIENCWRGGCKQFENVGHFKEFDNTSTYGYGCDMTSKYNGVCFWGYKCTWYQWSAYPYGSISKVYKLNNKGFEMEFEISADNHTKKPIVNENNLNRNLNQISVTQGLEFPLSVVSSLGVEKFFSNNVMGSNGGFLDVDASELNMPTRNRIGDIQIDRSGKSVIAPLSIVCKADDGVADCAMNTPVVKIVRKNRAPQSSKVTRVISEDKIEQRIPAHRTVALMFSHYNMKSIEVTRPRCNMSIAYSYGCKECNLNPRVIISSSSIAQEGMVYFKSNCSFNKQYLSCNYLPQTLELVKKEKYCYIYMGTINTTLHVNIEYEFVGEVMSNPLVFSQPEGFGIFKSFMITSGILVVITSVTRVIAKMAITKMAANAARENE